MNQSENASPTLGALARVFWNGFVTPSLGGVIAMTGFTVLAFAAIFLFVTPEWVANNPNLKVARDSQNADGFATQAAIKAASLPSNPKVAHMFVIGDSIIAQALASEDVLSSALERTTARVWHTTFLTTAGQTAIDEAALAEYATKRQPAVIVLPLGFGRLGYQPRDLIQAYQQARLGFRSDWADADVAMLGGHPARRTGVYVLDNRKFISRLRMPDIKVLTDHAAPHCLDCYVLERHIEAARLSRQRDEIIAALRIGIRDDDAGLTVLRDTARRLVLGGSKIIFVEDPINQNAFRTPADRALYAAYLRESAVLAQALGGYYCPLQGSYKPAPRAFVDYFHIDDADAQRHFRQVLEGCVGEVMAGSRA